MALIVEDGTGVNGAESYYSVEDTDTYFSTMRGSSATYQAEGDWLHEETEEETKEACLRWGTRLINKLWRFDGSKKTSTQTLPCPRTGIEDDDGDEVPSEQLLTDLGYATAEMARALLIDPERGEDQEVGLKSVDAEVKVVFDKYDRAGTLPKPVKQLLASLGKPKGGGSSREVARA